jgi:hypothetical protein
MRYLVIVFLLMSLGAFAQEPTYVPMKSNYLYKGIKMDSLFILPLLDTANARKVNGNLVRQSDSYYWYDSTKWTPLVTGGGGSTDTTSLSNRINQKIDSIKKSNDSVYFKKNGIWYFTFKDSVGSGQNGRWGNDTALIVMAKVHNATGTQLLKGEVVYISGANGDVASVKRANNKYDSTSATTIGMVKDNIAAGDTGWVVTQGQISKINTAAFTSGDIIYLDSIDGKFTKSKQYAPYHLVFIGVIERANAGNGQIYIKPQNGYELNELHDVSINNPINNQVLVYSDTQQLWKNRNVYSVVDTVSLSNRINLKLNISDTANMLNPYLRKADTVSLSNRINLKLNISDTANMLAPYLREADTVTISNRINAKLNISDTASMLTNYQRTSSFPMFVFGAGSGVAGDTSAFSTSTIYGAFYNDGVDTIIITGYRAIVQGTSASVTPTIYWNDTLSTTVATKAVNSPSAVTSTTIGNNITSLDNTKIAPSNWVWVQTGTVTTKPTFFSLTLFGYRKR